jgi:hypothetical protein
MNTSHFSWARAVVLACGCVAAGAADLSARPPSVTVGIHVPLPAGHGRVRVGRDDFFYYRGVFYRPGRHGYVVVRAPRGAIVRDLPAGYVRVVVGGRVFFRYADVYYAESPGGFVVVDAPVVVPSSPAPVVAAPAEELLWISGKEYVLRDGQFFVRSPEGLVWQPAPVGAVAKALPKTAKSMWYQDVEYFDCNGTVFRKTPDGYKVVPAPWSDTAGH